MYDHSRNEEWQNLFSVYKYILSRENFKPRNLQTGKGKNCLGTYSHVLLDDVITLVLQCRSKTNISAYKLHTSGSGEETTLQTLTSSRCDDFSIPVDCMYTMESFTETFSRFMETNT